MVNPPSARMLATCLGRRISCIRSVQPARGGGGGPVASSKPPSEPLVETDELTWDDGTANPEPCLDQFRLVGKNQALGMLVMGMGGFALLGYTLSVKDKPSKVPYVPREVLP